MYTGSQTNYANMSFKASSLGNGNPEFMGGVAKMSTPYGNINIPNPWAQTLAYRQSWNQGRWNVNEIGPMQRAQDPSMQYGSVGAIQGYVDSIMSKYPQLKQEGALNPYARATYQMQDAQTRLDQMRAQSMNRTETAIAGQANVMTNPLDSAIRDAEREIQIQSAERERLHRRHYGGSFDGGADYGLQQFEAMKPTTSNLPIVEKYLG